GARLYIEEVSNGSPEASANFMRNCHLGLEGRPKSILGRLRLLVGGSAPLDVGLASMVQQLKLAGFPEIKRCEYGDPTDPMFAQVEDRGRFIDENRKFSDS